GELELFGLPPGSPNQLARPLGRLKALAGRIGAKLFEPVDMHDRGVRTRGEDDEVAVPPLELLERREELVALRPGLGAAHALPCLAPGQLQHPDRLFGLPP